MLAKQEIITEEEKTVITDALNQIKTEIADGTLVTSTLRWLYARITRISTALLKQRLYHV